MGRPSKYPPEFRREAVELVVTADRSRVEVARSLGISASTLANRVHAERRARERAQDPDALSESELAELERLRKENVQQRVELEILRRAAAYFARETMRFTCELGVSCLASSFPAQPATCRSRGHAPRDTCQRTAPQPHRIRRSVLLARSRCESVWRRRDASPPACQLCRLVNAHTA